jgi:hypothetical protein
MRAISSTMSSMTSSEWIAEQFERCAPWIQAALDAEPIRTHTLRHVWDDLIDNRCQLWPTPNSVLVTELIIYPTGAKILYHWLAGGSWDEIKATHARVEEFAKGQGCIAVEVKGRRGWERLAKADGWKPVQTVYVKDLRNGIAG